MKRSYFLASYFQKSPAMIGNLVFALDDEAVDMGIVLHHFIPAWNGVESDVIPLFLQVRQDGRCL